MSYVRCSLASRRSGNSASIVRTLSVCPPRTDLNHLSRTALVEDEERPSNAFVVGVPRTERIPAPSERPDRLDRPVDRA